MKKEFKGTKNGAGKGMTPKHGYNMKNWYSNFGIINWGHKDNPTSKKSNKQK